MSLLDALVRLNGEVITHTIEQRSLKRALQIQAYVCFLDELVYLNFPEAGSVFNERSDCGSHSQLRWSLFHNGDEIFQLVLKHSACVNALRDTEMCEHCVMRKKWKRTCLTSSNVFYIIQIHPDKNRCIECLETIQFNRVAVPDADINLYQRSKPKPIYGFKTPRPTNRVRVQKLLQKVKRQVIAENEKAKEKTDKTDLKDTNDDTNITLEVASASQAASSSSCAEVIPVPHGLM